MSSPIPHGCRLRRHWIHAGLYAAAITGLTGLSLLMAADPVENAADASSSPATLMREGTRVADEPALCRSSGERLLVTLADQPTPLVALENLAAQRILKAVLDDAGDDRWVVAGQVTEFQGRNYLLLDRVVRQSKLRQ